MTLWMNHIEFDPSFRCSLFYRTSNAVKLVSGKYYSVFTRVYGPGGQEKKLPNQDGPSVEFIILNSYNLLVIFVPISLARIPFPHFKCYPAGKIHWHCCLPHEHSHIVPAMCHHSLLYPATPPKYTLGKFSVQENMFIITCVRLFRYYID